MDAFIVPIIIVFISFLILFLLGKRNEVKVQKEWDRLYELTGANSFAHVKHCVDSKVMAIDLAYGEANELKQLGSMQEALKLLDVGCNIITEFTPSMYRLIATMMRFSRMVIAITPVKPLKPGNFKIAQLASLALLNVVINQFLISMKDRFKLKLYIIGKGIYMAGSYLVKSTKTLIGSKGEEEKDWQRINDLLSDYKELSRETMACLQLIHDSISLDQAYIK